MSLDSHPINSALLSQLQILKQTDLTQSATQLLQRSNKAQRQESFKRALVELNQSFEEALADAVALRFNLHAGQRKKLHFKKDRTRILKQHGIDYPAIDGAETAQILLLITQSIVFDDAIVSKDLHDAFPFWKEGYPMVQFDNTYTLLAEDIQIHYQNVIDQLLKI
ncbi:hypothetical protein F4V57_13935 [Acinetobacter qingfengensis]|uniref:Uncharacterized protein n=1 Tax=Acinetobacter qingfengensis TaxID=1262585 RepID=A0A1E7REX5_9GAMM|nr:hypothetical protein [Acinetobacter qingfengensis]KAA8731177.1 hypothetical protein F4V57_13935 [Acinetobacter qingfengensis]OEY97846.1 hypothetical protein BJI46_08075 [Acinetobacter qingfengensis]